MDSKSSSINQISNRNFEECEDFESCWSELYRNFNSPVPVIVVSERPRSQHRNKSQRQSKRVNVARLATVIPNSQAESTHAIKDDGLTKDNNGLPITALYDTQNHLSAILMVNFKGATIPRQTIQLLAYVLPNFQNLTKFKIKNCLIDMYVVHELGKMLPYTTITDVCLDDCPLKQANYEELLKNTTNLKNLSLCRCKINAAVCERIASTLHYPERAEKSILTLNLTSNCIGDEGAKYFADALRSNRHLRYLNLADNNISDEGASLIFNQLMEFPLTYDENLNRRRRLMVYLKKKNDIYQEYLEKSCPPRKSSVGTIYSDTNKNLSHDKIHVLLPPKRGSLKKHKSVKRIEANSNISTRSTLSEESVPLNKAELIAKELVGLFVDPFCSSSLRNKDYPRCIGNFALCYLNLAYNNLSYVSVSKLLSVVEYQKVHCTPGDGCGLIKVILDGNFLPVACTKMETIEKMLNQNMASFKNKKVRS